jgi:competence protein ComEC
MGSIFLIAELLGRQNSAMTALTFAAAIMVAIQPQVLWDASFQLSYLAMAGLIFISPSLQTWFRKGITAAAGKEGTTVSLANFISDSFAVTLAAILATWPVIAYYFHVASFVGLPATFFSVLVLPGIIVTTALVAVVGLILPPLAWILGWISWLFISYFILIVRAFDALPFSSIRLENIQVWQIYIYYVALALTAAIIYYRHQLTDLSRLTISKIKPGLSKVSDFVSTVPKKWIASPLLLAVIFIWVAFFSMPDDRLHVSILDVGQGDAILIQTPSHQNILIDGGPNPQAIDLELSEKLPFWDRNIDLAILTEPQADHLAGLIEVLRNYRVRQVFEPGISYDSITYRQWLSSVESEQARYEIAHAGQQILLDDGIKIEVLHPPSTMLQGTSDDVDNNGLTLRLVWDRVSFLFTSDIGKEAEWYLIAQRTNLRSTVLKVSHHGSLTSTSQQFLAAVDPDVAVISVGTDNRFSLPRSEIVDRLVTQLGEDSIYYTSIHGTLEFITDGKSLWLKHDR